MKRMWLRGEKSEIMVLPSIATLLLKFPACWVPGRRTHTLNTDLYDTRCLMCRMPPDNNKVPQLIGLAFPREMETVWDRLWLLPVGEGLVITQSQGASNIKRQIKKQRERQQFLSAITSGFNEKSSSPLFLIFKSKDFRPALEATSFSTCFSFSPLSTYNICSPASDLLAHIE